MACLENEPCVKLKLTAAAYGGENSSDVVSQIAGCKQLDNVKAIIGASEKAGVDIIYVRHNDSSEIFKTNGRLVEWG